MTYIVDNTCLYFFHFATAEESVSGFGRSAGNQRVCKRSLVYNLRQCRPFGCFTFRFRESQMPNFLTPTFRGCKEMGWKEMGKKWGQTRFSFILTVSLSSFT